jgi:hypothetical protein
MFLFGFSILLHAYVGWRLLPAIGALVAGWGASPAWVAAPLGAWLAVSAVLMPWTFYFARRLRRRRLGEALTWAGMGGMGFFSSLFVLTVLRDVALLVGSVAIAAWGAIAGAEPAGAGTVHAAVSWSAAFVWVAAVLITLIGHVNVLRIARVVRVDVPIDGLPDGLHGFSIAQITDVHVGPTIKRRTVSRIVEEVNRLEPHMVAVTGDLVDGSVADLAEHVAPLADLASRHGTFFVTGNHEYYSGAHAWIRELRRLGVSVLVNEHVVLEHGGASLAVAGVADTSAHHFDPSHRSDPGRAIDGAPDHVAVRLLLAHQPRSAVHAVQAGYHLQLSGHTHGGQFWPWNHFIRRWQPFTAGLHRLQHLWVYTSRGTGYWGPPKRFGAPSEITLVRLVPARPQGSGRPPA